VCIRQCESLAQENEQLKEKVEELSVDLQIIKEEIATAGSVTYLLRVFSCNKLSKNVARLACYNFDVNENKFDDFFGRDVTEEVSSQMILFFQRHLASDSALFGKTQKPPNRLMYVRLIGKPKI